MYLRNGCAKTIWYTAILTCRWRLLSSQLQRTDTDASACYVQVKVFRRNLHIIAVTLSTSGGMATILFCSILGCVLPLQEVALCQSPPTFSVLCYPCSNLSLLPHNVISSTTLWSSDWSHSFYLPHCASNSPSIIFHLMCPAHFHFVLVTYWTMSVTLVLCLMMVLGILSFSLILSIFLSIAHWLVSSFPLHYQCLRLLEGIWTPGLLHLRLALTAVQSKLFSGMLWVFFWLFW